jgi:hypothetical protein
MVLNAGKNTAVGTTTGGNIIISGTPTISVGATGVAKLYTGSITGSTGLTAKLVSGSGRFRYNSDETNQNYTKTLSAGLNAIYREQPSIAPSISSASKTYDGVAYSGTPTLTYALANGDTFNATDIIQGTVTLTGAGSLAGTVNAGSYTIGADLTGFSNTLGYANPTTATAGTLTINKKALSLSGTKVYDSTANVASNAFTITAAGLVGSETVTLSGTGTIADKNVANAKVVTTTGLSLVDGTNGGLANNYTLTGGTYTVDITKADISSIDGITASNKIYDRTTTATLDKSTAVTFNGKISGDTLTVATATGNFSDKNVADGKTVDITGLTLGGVSAVNYNLTTNTATTTANITAKAITLNSVTAANREYNGVADASATVSAYGSFTGVISGDGSGVSVDTTNVVASFIDGNKANGKAVSVTGIALSGTEAGNYSIVGGFSTIANITVKTLGIAFDTAPTKVYDGTTTATGGSGLALTGVVSGDAVTIGGAFTTTYLDKNVGENKHLAFTGLTLGGSEQSNYQIVLGDVATNASITKLDSVTWTGGGSTNSWFDAANWGGKVPDLSNVANVIIPAGVTVSFDTSGASTGVSTSAVGIDSLGSLGSMTMANGTLNVSDSIALNTLTQSGGAIGGATSVTVNTLAQSGGSIANIGDLHVNSSFTQSNTAGTISVGGDVAITQATGDLVLGNIANGGKITANATAGNISQLSGATLKPTTLATFNASGNIALTNAGNDFSSIALSGADVSFKDDTGGVILDNVTTTGTLNAVSSAGAITQNPSAVLSVGGIATLNAGTADVTLSNATNDFKNTVNVVGKDVSLKDVNGIELGNVASSGTLGVSAVDDITQKTGTALSTTGNVTLASSSGNVTLDSTTNNFGGSLGLSGDTVALSNYAHALTLGDVTSQIALNIATTGAITQATGATLISNGTATLNAGTADISLANAGNDFTTLALSGANVSFKDDTGGVVLNDVTTTGTLSAVSSDGAITQNPLSTTFSVAGVATLNAGTADVTLSNTTNDFKNTVNVVGANVALADKDGIELGTVTTTGTLGVDAVGNITQNPTSVITATGETTLASTSGDIALSGANDFKETVSASGVNVALNDINGIELGAITSTGTLGVDAAEDITQATGSVITATGETTLASTSGDIALSGANDFKDTVNASGANVALNDVNGIELGAVASTGTLGVDAVGNISQASGTALSTTGDVTLASSSGDITLDSATNNFGGSLGLSGDTVALSNYAHALTLGDVASQTALNITTTNQAIAQATGTTLVSNGTATLNAGTADISLANAGNDFTTLALSGANVSFKDDTGGVVLNDVTTTGTLSAVSSDGAITQNSSAVLSVGGIATLNAGTADVTLSNATNDFKNTVNVVGANVALADANSLELGAVTSTGTLGVGAVGNITQNPTSVITATGATTLASTNGDVKLDGTNNDFSTINVSGKDIALADKNGIELGNVTSTGTLGLTALDNITQNPTSVITATGATTLASTSGDVKLDGTNNDFSTINVSGKDVALADKNGIELGNVTSTGTLGVDAVGNISQKAGTALNTGSDLTLSSSTGNVKLDSASNNFGGALSASGKDITLSNYNHALTLGNVTSQTALNITTTNQAITQATGTTLVSNGTASLDAGTSDVTLSNSGNDFNVLTLAGNNLAFSDSIGGVTLGSIATAGTFSATSTGGNIAQASGATLALTGDASFDSGTNNTVLTNAGNDFTTLALVGKDVSFKDEVGTTTLGNVATTGALSAINTVGGITQSSGASMAIGTDAVFDVGTNNFALSNSGNSFGSLGVTATNVDISNITGNLTLANMNVAGTLGVNIDNDILQKSGTTVSVTGETTLASTSGDVKLDGTNNDFSTVNVSGANVALADKNGIELGNVTSTGTLGVDAVGNISQSPTSVITATGATTLASTSGDVKLDGANNDFSTINASGANVSFVDSVGGVILGNVATRGSFSATSKDGTIDQEAGTALAIGGISSFDAGSSNINLTSKSNNFSGIINVKGGEVILESVAAPKFGVVATSKPIKGGKIQTSKIDTLIAATINSAQIQPVVVAPIQLQNTPENSPKTEPQNIMTQLQQFAGKEAIEPMIVSQVLDNEDTLRITLTELEGMQKNVTQEPLRVAMNQNSIVSLVSGGVRLLDGLDQEFYLVKEDKKSEKKK